MPNGPNQFRPTKWPREKWESLPWCQKLYYGLSIVGTFLIIALGFLLAFRLIAFIITH